MKGVGYNFLSLILASLVVKRQSHGMPPAFRLFSHAFTSSIKRSCVAIRLLSYWLERAQRSRWYLLSAGSELFSQLSLFTWRGVLSKLILLFLGKDDWIFDCSTHNSLIYILEKKEKYNKLKNYFTIFQKQFNLRE